MIEERVKMRALFKRAVKLLGAWRIPSFGLHPYYAQGDFGRILPFRGVWSNSDSSGLRSLTAAQAANEFTRNCVLGFRRKLVLSKQKRDTGFRKVLSRHFAYLNPYFCLGIPVPLLRYGERYALFISMGANAGAAVREVKVRTTI